MRCCLYIYQGAIEDFGWLSSSQMMDGLALGESTPGPLIMVVAFVGFVGAWGKAPFGPDALLLAGCWQPRWSPGSTFPPSFLFIFAGGPLVESTHGDPQFTAPLTAITARGRPGVMPTWRSSSPATLCCGRRDFQAVPIVAAAIALGAAVALFRFKANVIHVIAVCAGPGWPRVST